MATPSSQNRKSLSCLFQPLKHSNMPQMKYWRGAILFWYSAQLHINSNLSEDVGLIFSFGCWSRNYLKSLLRSCETSVWQDPPKNQTDSEFFSSQIHLSMKGLVILSRALLHQSHQAAIYQQGSNIMIVNPPPNHPPSGTLQTDSNTSSRKEHICYARDIFEHLYQMWI